MKKMFLLGKIYSFFLYSIMDPTSYKFIEILVLHI